MTRENAKEDETDAAIAPSIEQCIERGLAVALIYGISSASIAHRVVPKGHSETALIRMNAGAFGLRVLIHNSNCQNGRASLCGAAIISWTHDGEVAHAFAQKPVWRVSAYKVAHLSRKAARLPGAGNLEDMRPTLGGKPAAANPGLSGDYGDRARLTFVRTVTGPNSPNEAWSHDHPIR
jgi:hypothetical protein